MILDMWQKESSRHLTSFFLAGGVLSLVGQLAEATLICKTFSLACIRSLQPLPVLGHHQGQPAGQQPSTEQLEQLVWFDADDDGSQDYYDDDDQAMNDYTAIEGLASHQDISELVWMEAGDDDNSDETEAASFHLHRVVVSSASWQPAGGSVLVEALQPSSSSAQQTANAAAADPGGSETIANESTTMHSPSLETLEEINSTSSM